jgi:PAS domain-containing protein
MPIFPATANGTDWASSHNFQGLLEQILAGVTTPIYVKNQQHQWLFANCACWQLLGRSPQPLQPWSEPPPATPIESNQAEPNRATLTETEVWSAEQLAAIVAHDQAVSTDAAPPALTVTLTDGEGRLRQFERRIQPAAMDSGLLICFLEPSLEVAPLVKAPQFETLLANIPAIIYRCYA